MNTHRPPELQLDRLKIRLSGLTSCGLCVNESRESFAARMEAGRQCCLPTKGTEQTHHGSLWSPTSQCSHFAAGREIRKAQNIDDSATESKAGRAPLIAA